MLRTPRALRALTLALLAAGCSNAGDTLGIKLPGGGSVNAQVFIDRDFNGVLTAPDTIYAGIPLYLLVTGGQADTVATGSTDAGGVVVFRGITVGRYTIAVDSAPLGDSLQTYLTPPAVQVTATGGAPLFAVRLGYPTDDVPGVRASTAGRRVVTTGIILAGPQSAADSSAAVRDEVAGVALRLTGARVIVGSFAAPGDSVRVLGTVAMSGGQPVLANAQIALVQPGFAAPVADTLLTAEAAAALAGARDADLVRIQAALVTDSSTVGGEYRIVVDDGSGPLTVALDSVLSLPPTVVVPGDSLRVNGILRPAGAGSWQLRPRAGTDLTVY